MTVDDVEENGNNILTREETIVLEQNKGPQAAEQERLNAGQLKYSNRFFVTDREDDVVMMHDGSSVNKAGFHMRFDLAFEPTFSTSLDTDEDGNPVTTVHIMCGNKIVGEFAYNNDVLNIDMDDPCITPYKANGMRITLPISDAEGGFEYELEVSNEWYTSFDDTDNILTRFETKRLENESGVKANDENNDPEGMDVERDEDGNITGMGFSMTGNNPDQEARNLNTLLNVFKNGGSFAPIDDILNKDK